MPPPVSCIPLPMQQAIVHWGVAEALRIGIATRSVSSARTPARRPLAKAALNKREKRMLDTAMDFPTTTFSWLFSQKSITHRNIRFSPGYDGTLIRAL